MYRKISIIGLLVLAVIGLLYYANVSYIRSEYNKNQDELNARINELQTDKQNLQTKIDEIKNQAQKDLVKGNLTLTDVQIRSNSIYTEGTLKGAIYGNFDVVARVRNNSNAEISNIKVASLFAKSNVSYEKEIGVDAKAQRIDKLSPGEEREVTFSGYKVEHPETRQEVIVNVFHPSIGDINDTSNVKKVNLKVAFPPGSED